jgi:phosphohistidine phosphatase
MDLVIVRHAIALEPGTAGMTDAERPLSPEGEKRFRKAARGLARIADPPEFLFTSPLLRARQTAEIAAGAWGVALTEAPVLGGGSVAEIRRWLSEHAASERIAIVGHEPTLSGLLAFLIHSDSAEAIDFKKGAAALVAMDAGGARGVLRWFASPRLLRELGD